MSKKVSFSGGYVWRSVLSILVGLVFIIWPEFTASYIVTIIGTVLLTVGVVMIIAYYGKHKSDGRMEFGFPASGVLFLLAGILLIAMPKTFATVMIAVMGLVLILGAIEQIYALVQASHAGFRVAAWRYVAPVLIAIAGVVIAFSPATSLSIILVVFGISTVVYGIAGLMDVYMVNGGNK